MLKIKNLKSLLILTTLTISVLEPRVHATPTALRFPVECVARAVLSKMGESPRAEIQLPKVFLSSLIPLVQFQDAVERQWHARPDRFTNVYIFALNEIYLVDSLELYQPVGRILDDSLAHELAHFVQIQYRDQLGAGDDDWLESQAVNVQTWFREQYKDTGRTPCQDFP